MRSAHRLAEIIRDIAVMNSRAVTQKLKALEEQK